MVPTNPATLIEVGNGYVWLDGVVIGLLTQEGHRMARELGAE
jgi:hypothetical protein